MTERLTDRTSEVQILIKLKLWCKQHQQQVTARPHLRFL